MDYKLGLWLNGNFGGWIGFENGGITWWVEAREERWSIRDNKQM